MGFFTDQLGSTTGFRTVSEPFPNRFLQDFQGAWQVERFLQTLPEVGGQEKDGLGSEPRNRNWIIDVNHI